MWSVKNSSWDKSLLAVMCRIFMGLKKRDCKTADKIRSKIRIARGHDKLLHKGEIRSFHGGENSQPQGFMGMPHGQPVIELVAGNGKTFTDTFHRIQSCKEFCKDTEDKEQPVTRIRDDKIRKDSMSMPAGTDKARDTQIMADWFTINKVNNRAPIIGVDAAGTLSAALRTGPKLGLEFLHKGIKERFR